LSNYHLYKRKIYAGNCKGFVIFFAPHKCGKQRALKAGLQPGVFTQNVDSFISTLYLWNAMLLQVFLKHDD
jgi:hypothetical protein